jgi:hypothetical protein
VLARDGVWFEDSESSGRSMAWWSIWRTTHELVVINGVDMPVSMVQSSRPYWGASCRSHKYCPERLSPYWIESFVMDCDEPSRREDGGYTEL